MGSSSDTTAEEVLRGYSSCVEVCLFEKMKHTAVKTDYWTWMHSTHFISRLQLTRMTGKTPNERMNSRDMPSGSGNDEDVSEQITMH
jgi:hypothetical protein